MSTINKAAASMQTPADYTPRKEDFALLEQHDIATDKNFASQGYWKGVAIHFFRNKRAVTGLVIVLLIVFFAVFGPMLSRYGYKDIVSITTKVNGRNRQITAGGLAPRIPWLHKLLGGEAYEDQFADRTFIFGTDDMGRDLWTRTWHGARVSLLIAFITILIDMIVGMSYGLVSGYFGGVTDNIMQRFVEVANSVPRLVIVSVLAIFMKNPLLALLGCGLCGLSVGIMWPGTFSISAGLCPQGGTLMFALLALAGDVGCASGPAVVSFVSGFFPEYGIKAGLLAAIIFPAVMIALLVWNKRTIR